LNRCVEQNPNSVKHILIVGGGFAGVDCVRKLAGNLNVLLTLLDKDEYKQFQPRLCQLATAVLDYHPVRVAVSSLLTAVLIGAMGRRLP
jgi:NADH dehydrogenase